MLSRALKLDTNNVSTLAYIDNFKLDLLSKMSGLKKSEARDLVMQTGQCVPEFEDYLYSEDLY